MIREATKADIERIADLLIAQVKDNGWVDQSGMEPDLYTVKTLLNYHIRHKDAVVFVHEDEDELVDGFIVGALLPFMLDIRRHAAHEKMSGGKHTDKLWEHFRQWAKEEDACATVRGCYNVLDGERLKEVS